MCLKYKALVEGLIRVEDLALDGMIKILKFLQNKIQRENKNEPKHSTAKLLQNKQGKSGILL